MAVWILAPMTRGDIDPVLAIEQTLFTHPWTRAAFESERRNEDAIAVVVRPAGAEAVSFRSPIIGYAVFRRIVDELHILKLGVATAYQRRGVARWLLKTCVDTPVFPKASTVFLEVRETNTGAIQLYRQAGFHVVGHRHGYYADTNENALLMMKYLKEDDHEH